MHAIQLSNQQYRHAKDLAFQAGFDSVDEYVISLISDPGPHDTLNFDHKFTPEFLAELDRDDAEIAAGGKLYSIEEVRAHSAAREKEWLRKRNS